MTTTERWNDERADLDEDWRKALQDANLAPLWDVLAALVTPTPQGRMEAATWSYETARPLLMKAGELISAARAERRVLILENPAAPGESRITDTLYAGLQLILPGEVAPAHRHTQSALRFIMEGSGAFTALDGERIFMEKYDLILTPNWVWHDHGNETNEAMVWLDGLDIPLLKSLDASFAEHRPDRGACPPGRAAGDTQKRWGRNLRPVRGVAPDRSANPLYTYPFKEWSGALAAMEASDAPHPHEGYRLEFRNPLDGGAVMSTISAFAQSVPAGFHTAPMRSTDGTIFVVVSGTGAMTIGDREFALSEGTVVVAPSWSTRRIRAGTRLVLFSYSDRTVQEKLNLWREELLPGD